MSLEVSVVDVTDLQGDVVAPDWLAKAEPVHRQLRPLLPRDYAAKMRRVFDGGGRMCVAVCEERAVGVAVYRVSMRTPPMGARCMSTIL